MDDYITSTIAGYDVFADEYARQTFDHAPKEERERFVLLIRPHGCILDVGCGNGRDCGYFAEKGFQVHGVDLSEKLLAIAKNMFPTATFSQADIRHLPFMHDSFDAIWSCMSLVHIKHEDVLSVLKSFYSILKKDGILFVYVKKGDGEIVKEEPSVPGFKRFYSLFQKDKLRQYITDAHFTIIDCYERTKCKEYVAGNALPRIVCFAKKV